MSRLKDIPEQSHSEYFLGTSELVPLSKYIPKEKPKGERLKGIKGAPKLSEDIVRDKCTTWMRYQGWTCKTIYTGGIPIGNGRLATNPSKGIPDCLVFIPKFTSIIWIEWKKSHGGILSPEQTQWHKDLRFCGQFVYTISSIEQLKEEMKGWL